MGFNFRKSLKIAPGVRLNITKKGLTSVSVAKKGAIVNLKANKVKSTFGIPKTGLSYSKEFATKRNNATQPFPLVHRSEQRNIGMLLLIGIVLMPYIFAWFTLRAGYSATSRFLSFTWLIVLILIAK